MADADALADCEVPVRDRDHTAQAGPNFVEIDVAQLIPRPVRADELPELRAMWWRQARLGHRLPAERGVILITGRAV